MQRLAGKVAIVTGAGSGIGQGIAKRLGGEGAKVIVDYVGDPAGAKETQKRDRAGGWRRRDRRGRRDVDGRRAHDWSIPRGTGLARQTSW